MSAILVRDLGKAYRQYPSRWARLAEWSDPRHKPRHHLHWVLRDLNFSIEPGEAVGIIGVNGAGKSTLLKMITGTTQPTIGTVNVAGRVAALLELGMGFHSDFTGRQNVYMAGQLLGYSIEEIDRRMPDILAFAEIGSYIDQPVRMYSSGMQVRLAFAVAVADRPDVLIVDEALAVGDVHFQQKCYHRIRQYVADGTTLLFVTHGMSTVLEFCTRAIYLRAGAIASDGSPKEAVDLYQADVLVKSHEGDDKPTINPGNSLDSGEAVSGSAGSMSTDGATCADVALLNGAGEKVAVVLSEESVELIVRYRLHRYLEDPHVGFKIRTATGTVIFESNTYCMSRVLGAAQTDSHLEVRFSFAVDLSPGDYTITVGLANGSMPGGVFREVLSYMHDVISFKVLPNPSAIIWAGVVNLHPVTNWQWLDSHAFVKTTGSQGE
ncbi:ABC transporter ATP-binding protein [Rhizobium cauense]|uniref:ABC transporter ATP-binding protein n=1 Tax=Rhizobium cauense TaxID=1166683 RepID=UPI001C6E20C7|nr:ABC transporter ATP-binding protein [Rhizobium cauense]MBW9118297.1 ABC transporter ATP-binding protein [Rhizobium cauense]